MNERPSDRPGVSSGDVSSDDAAASDGAGVAGARVRPSGRPSDPVAPLPSLEVLLGRDQISAKVAELGRRIADDYDGKPLVLLCVLKGSFIFAADLARCIPLPLRVEFLGVKSYGNDSASSGAVQITQDLTRPIENDHVLLVEDIIDTGLTAHFLLELVSARRPKSVRLCSLLHKPSRQEKSVFIDYLGFTIDDYFVVGYGLDYAQTYRNLPDICILPPSLINDE